MRILATFGFAAVILLAAGPVSSGQAADRQDKSKAIATSPCQKPLGPERIQEPPVDLSSSGLIFDPRAPGGARPGAADRADTPIDPAAITLFPPSARKPKSSGANHEKIIPCRP